MARVKREVVLRLGVVGGACLAGLGFGLGKWSKPAGAAVVPPVIFFGNVTSGRDADLTLAGSLALTFGRSGAIRGTLTHRAGTFFEKGAKVLVTGKAAGHTLYLTFHLPGGRQISGVGTAAREIRDIRDVLPIRGSLRGPARGDKGDWVACSAGQPTCGGGSL